MKIKEPQFNLNSKSDFDEMSFEDFENEEHEFIESQMDELPEDRRINKNKNEDLNNFHGKKPISIFQRPNP